MAAVADPEQQLAWEAKQRPRVAVAAILAGILTLGGDLWSGAIFRDVPRSGLLESLGRAVQTGPIGGLESGRLGFFEFYDERGAAILGSAIARGIGFLLLGYAVTFLAAAVRARRPEFSRPALYVTLVGAVLSGVAVVLGSLGSAGAVSEVLDGPRTVDAVGDAGSSSVLVMSAFLELAGQLLLGVGLVLVSLNAQKVGLLTRFLGVLGIITGALVVIPIGPLPIVQAFWLIALGLIALDRVPGGAPPAWRTGKAEPWPSQQEVAEARRAQQEARRRGDDDGRPGSEDDAEPAAAGPAQPSSRKRRRKRRS